MSGTLLFSEILDKVHKAKTKTQKINILREHNSEALRMIIKASFDPKIEWAVPEGSVPFKRNEAPAGTEHSVLAYESRKLWHFIKGAETQLYSSRKNKCLYSCWKVYTKVKQTYLLQLKIKDCIKYIKAFQNQ